MELHVKVARAAAALAVALLASPAAAQLAAATDRAQGLPAGLTLPVLGAATAEEPTALGVNPAGVGFVRDLNLQYFHEEGPAQDGRGDGLYLADRFGPLGVGYGVEWLHPGQDLGPRYDRQRLALTLGDGRTGAFGFGWTWVGSKDGALDAVSSWDIGLTTRPARWLSIGAAALGQDARLSGQRLPVRFDVGVATRLLRDRLTLSADLLADDFGGDTFRTTALTFGAGAELGGGLALGLQAQTPIRDATGIPQDTAWLVTASWNAPHTGVTGGATALGKDSGWLLGARSSIERYRAPEPVRVVPTIDVDDALRPRRFLFLQVGDPDPYGALVARLTEARDDPSLAGVIVKIDALDLGAGRVEELRSLLAAVRARKPVLAYLTGGGTREYWLASAATAVAAPPGASLMVNGFATSQLYLRDLLARLGVSVQVVRAGAYKSATEPLIRTGPSPEAAEATQALLDSVYGSFVDDVAAARRLAPEQVRALVDQGLFTSEEASAAGLLDAVLWPDEVKDWARRTTRRGLVTGRYDPTPHREAERWGQPPVVEVIRLEGMITREGAAGLPSRGPRLAGASAVAAALHRAAADPDVRAIVLRIESPGGDGLASDLIWREVQRARQKGKVVIASMGDLAASGGYLAAVAADAILAEPSTLTGSIGVFAAKPDLSGLLEKISVNRTAWARGDKAQLTSIARPWSEAEQAVLQKQIDAFYRLFLARVAEGRHLPVADVEAVAGGRVWTGRQALERRLVDRLGTLADAVALARERAGVDPTDVVEVRRAGASEGMLSRIQQVTLAPAASPAADVLARLVEASPEVSSLLLLSDLGPVLALPEAWVLPAAAP
ncbi:MAG: signal peptide peptidase SppA [Anaeromyxobacter sp.]